MIEAVRASAYTIPTDGPEGDGTFAWDSTTLVLVEVSADGVTGTGWTYGSPACATVVTGDLAKAVTGRDPMDVIGSWNAMRAALRNIGRPGVAGMAMSAVDCALWDLKARLLGLPLHRLLGAVHDSVPVYGSGGFTTYDERQLAEQLSGWVDEGIPRVKIKIGESSGTCEDRDLARVAQARKVIGTADLYVDANGGYTVGQACRVASRLTEYDVTWFEEPVSSDDLAGLRVVRDHTGIDVTAGEYGYDLVYFERMSGSVDCLQADITRCGGITELLRIAAVAEAHGLQLSGHCAPGLHIAPLTAVPNLRHLEWFHDHTRIESMLFDGLPTPVEGAVTPPDTPGHGLTWRPSAAAAYRVA
ncbi:enolase C-terminal domain-like protein [Kribbella jejuensis]|uniref:L-alanine-DL-glutamate epimerase-like enolase superfamily enzyme n=1 Tax=Kribbella jejuensis TaxID=236068 RepID=A0A542ELD6_9ACTN|nr:enolase C-terminal domain-like protein [Kribbella jejuensis]TQJ16125.1 L-alanine-DL-glutamate epimerase-like enolase superfamily enzyme [Kribbella jejuensis]